MAVRRFYLSSDACAERSVLTLHDGYVHGPPARPRHAAEARPVCDGWTAPAGHQASPAGTNTESERRASITMQRDSDKSS